MTKYNAILVVLTKLSRESMHHPRAAALRLSTDNHHIENS